MLDVASAVIHTGQAEALTADHGYALGLTRPEAPTIKEVEAAVEVRA
jgi:hypothetical protein